MGRPERPTVSRDPRALKVFEWYLVVEGRFSFPVDMLRYDSCFPFEQEDAALLEHHHNEPRRVVLIRRGASSTYGTPDRWRSFGWKIVAAEREPDLARAIARQPAGSAVL